MNPPSARANFLRWLNETPDESVLRLIFGALLIGAIGVFALDYRDLATRPNPKPHKAATASPGVTGEPLPDRRGRRGGPGQKGDARLRAPMTFDLLADGRLMAVGTIEVGTAGAFAAEVAKRGSYVKKVVLHSPGGSVTDAIKIGRLIREMKFATAVEDGSYCASSCPLIFAGGLDRRAAPKAAIGVHQIAVLADRPVSADEEAGSVQQVSALCQKYLRDTGIDLQVWLHAMETPKEQLYYFKPDELIALRLATGPDALPKDGAKSGS